MSSETSKKQDIKISLETWDPANGKGIDDLLAAGHSPQVLEDEAALEFAKKVKKEALKADPSPAMRRIKAQVEKVKAEQSASLAFDEDFIKSLAGQPTHIIGEIKATLKELLGSKLNLNDFVKAIKEVQQQRNNLVVLDGGAKQEKGLKIPPLLEHEYGYYRNVDRGGELWPEVLSNFKLFVKERIVMQDGKEILKAVLVVEDGSPREVLIPYNALLSSRDLQLHLKTSEVVWMGKDIDVQLLKNHLRTQNAIRLKGVETVGRHENLIVLPKIVIGAKGPIENPNITFVNTFNEGSKFIHLLPSRWPTKEEHLAAAISIYKNLPRINKANITGGIIGWLCALPWCDLIRQTPGWGGFPHLNLWSEGGAGKTETSKTILRICGVPYCFEPFALPKTPFTRINLYAITNLIPIFFDEYREKSWNNGVKTRIHEELRGNYNRSQDERGRPNLEVKVFQFCAPIILAGEDRPRDTVALEERIISLNLKKDIVNSKSKLYKAECVKAFDRLHKSDLENFALHFWSWTLGYENWLEGLENARLAVRDWAKKNQYIMPNRVLNNLSILLFGWSIFEEYGSFLGLKPTPFIDGGTFKDAFLSAYFEVMPDGKQRSELDNLFMLIGQMVVNGVLEREVHYTSQENLIVIRFNEVLPLCYKYSRETNGTQDLLGIDAYRSLLQNALEREDSYIKNTSARTYFNSPSGGRSQFRGVAFDPVILEENAGVEAAIWMPGEGWPL